MRNAPSMLSAMLMLAVFLCFGKSGASYACTDCECFSDNSCSTGQCDEHTTANCNRQLFTPTCSGSYSLYTEVQCAGGANCGKCNSCANIFKLSGGQEIWLANCHTIDCNTEDCTNTCSNVTTLSAGVQYVIYVCKMQCPTAGNTCENCSTNCTAYACVFSGASSSPCTP